MSTRLSPLVPLGIASALLLAGCSGPGELREAPRSGSFQDDLAVLDQAGVGVTVLSSSDGQARVAVCPAWQGRVLTSTLAGPGGRSLGWINRQLIASRTLQPHINAFGGEDRFWLGPEGGQFSLFFAQGAPFDLAHWQTPAPIDTDAYPVASRERDRVLMRKEVELANYSGTRFALTIEREVRLLEGAACWRSLGVSPQPGVRAVAFESDNRITNSGTAAWSRDTGLLSIWILGMFPPSPRTTVVVPFKAGSEADLGPAVNDSYFGTIGAERLMVGEQRAFFKADGASRGKIGVPPRRCRPVVGSWDALNQVLTIVQFSFDERAREYVNSQWRIQDHPYAGDVLNCYNDGPPAPGAKPLGPFYEMESSSPALALAPGQFARHVHRTLHLSGDPAAVDAIARAILGVSLAEIAAAQP